MAKWARVENGVVAEVVQVDPSGKFHPSLIWTPCLDAVQVGWVHEGDGFVAPVIPIEKLQAIMKDAIKGKEAQRNGRKIERPNIAGAFFDPSPKINRIISRCDALANTDPLPTNNGCFDDIDENPVPMTVGQLKKLRNAIIDREELNYAARKAHIKAMKLAANPITYDYSSGWV